MNGKLFVGALLSLALLPAGVAQAGSPPPAEGENRLLIFAGDGLRQDKIVSLGKATPGFRELIRGGVRAADGGLQTQAPTNTGPGWSTLSTGAWPGVNGATNNTFHVNGQPFDNSSSAFAPGTLQAETIAQAAERGGKRVAQIEWSTGAVGAIDGPTIDYRRFFSGRGVATNYIAKTDLEKSVQSAGLQFDHPKGFAGNDGYAQAAPRAAKGWKNVPRSERPARELRLRVLDRGEDKYGLNAYIYDSTRDGRENYDRVILSPTKRGSDKVGELREGGWADVRIKLKTGDAMNGKTAAMVVKLERLTGDLSEVRLYHSSVTRANATWKDWPGAPGFKGDFEDYVAERFPSSQSGDYAVAQSGIVSEDTFMEQALYWEKSYHPLIKYVIATYKPDLALVGYPVADQVQHEFTGLVTKNLPDGQPNPAYDSRALDGKREGRAKARKGYIDTAYIRADATMRVARKALGGTKKANTIVSSDHGFAPQFAAIDASKVLVDLGLLSTPQTGNCRPAADEKIGKAKVCWAGGSAQVYLNVEGRDPAGKYQQVAPADIDKEVERIRLAFEGIEDSNDWNGDGKPEGWEVIADTYSKAQTRMIANGSKAGVDMAHPTRTGDVVVISSAPYQFDASTPGSLVARAGFFGQHGYRPDGASKDGAMNVRATLLAGGPALRSGPAPVGGVRSIDVAPTAAMVLGVPAPAQSQGRARRDLLRDGKRYRSLSIVSINDFHGQLSPTTKTIDGLAVPAGGAAELATMFDEEVGAPGTRRGLLIGAGDSVGASPPSSSLLEDRPTIDVQNAWKMSASTLGNHEFDYGQTRLRQQIERAEYPLIASNVVDEKTGDQPSWLPGVKVLNVGDGVRVGIIGAAVRQTPELVGASATAGLKFLDEAERIRRASEQLSARGIQIQVVSIHEGTNLGSNRVAGNPATPYAGPIAQIARSLRDTSIDLIIGGHTHMSANTRLGGIPFVSGPNAGAGYSASQLMVRGGEVSWVGTQSRTAKTLGVTPREDVRAIVDRAEHDTAETRNRVIGRQDGDIVRDPRRLTETALGNLVADSMRRKYPEAKFALTNSGGLRADIRSAPPAGREEEGEITWGEAYAVLPFGNRTTLATIAGSDLRSALENGFSPACDPNVHTGRFPQVSGLKLTFSCEGSKPVIDELALAPEGPGGPKTPIEDSDSLRFVTNDFMITGGDGYSALQAATDISRPDAILDTVVDYIGSNSPVAPKVDGRIVRLK